MNDISLKGIIGGAIVSIVAVNLLLLPLGVYMMHSLVKPGVTPEDLSATVNAMLQHDPLYFSLAAFLGALASVLGGYVAAWIADGGFVLNGALASFLTILGGVYELYIHVQPLWLHAVMLILAPALSALGGWLRSRPVYTGY